MPKIDLDALEWKHGSSYLGGHAEKIGDRSQKRLGDPAGLTQFGVNLVRLGPGALSSLRHWHEEQDEFLVVTQGALVLVDDHGETPLAPGDCCAFPAGEANGHHILNHSDSDGAFVVVGTRTAAETGWYSDVDMKVTVENGQMRFARRDGSPLEGASPIPDPDFATISDKLTQTLLAGDTAGFADLCCLPHTIIPRTGEPYVLRTREEMAKDMQLYHESLKLHHVTDMFRVQKSITRPSPDRADILAKVHLMAGTQRIVDPYDITFSLVWTGADWRIARIESELEHINWTLGRTGLPESGSFEGD